jgi:hypothetical protein
LTFPRTQILNGRLFSRKELAPEAVLEYDGFTVSQKIRFKSYLEAGPMRLYVAIAFGFLFAGSSQTPGVLADCEPGRDDRVTSHFAYSASSDQGAVGDVVAIELSLTLATLDLVVDDLRPSLIGFDLTGCYDGQTLELLDQVQYSEFLDSLTLLTSFYSFGGFPTPQEGPTRGIWQFFGNFKRESIEPLLGSGAPFPFMTLFFRVRGEPGQTTAIEFCDDVVAGKGCSSNLLLYSGRDSAGASRFFDTRSTKHISGMVRVLPGDPTRPAPPSVPDNAKTYQEAPTPENTNIAFELEGPAVTHPGATNVPFKLFVTSNYEFSGFMTSVVFQAEYLELDGVEEHTRPGLVAIDNQGGNLGLLMSSSRRRVGAEGERVLLATLYFNVKESAQATSSLSLGFEPAGNYYNWLAIQYQDGVNPDALPTVTEVSPIFLGHALVGVQTEPTRLGDVNLDYELNLTDAVVLLDYLFRGGTIICDEAADANQDSAIDLSDPITVLQALFVGGTISDRASILCGTSS